MDRGSAEGILGQALERVGLALGLVLLSAWAAAPPPPGPLAPDGPLRAPLAAPAGPLPPWTEPPPAPMPTAAASRRAPLPVLRPSPAVLLPPPAKPPPPDPEPQVARLPMLKPLIEAGWLPVPAPKVLWPPPAKPPAVLVPAAITPAAGPTADIRAKAITVDHGAAARPAADAAIAIAGRDQHLESLDRAARAALLAGDPAGALRLYERLAGAAPAARATRLGQAIALQQLGRSAEARAVYQGLLQADPDDLDAKTALLGMLAEQAPDEALALLRRLARQHPDDHRLPAQIAFVLARRGDLAAAIAAAHRAVALAPSDPGDRANLAVLLDRAGQRSAAIEQYRSALELATLGGAPTSRLDAIAARLHHLRQPPPAPSP